MTTLRTVPPELTQEATSKLTDITANTIEELVGHLYDKNPDPKSRIFLPIGSGLRFTPLHMITATAFHASLAAALSNIMRLPLGKSINPELPAAPPHIKEHYARSRALLTNTKTPPKLQSMLAAEARKAHAEDTRKNLTQTSKAICASADAKHVKGWLLAIPSTPELTITNKLMLIALALFLRIPLFPADTPCTSCPGETLDAPNTHILRHPTKNGNYHRHQAIVNVLLNACRRAHIPVSAEPKGFFKDNRRRPDLLVARTGPNKADILMDVSIASTEISESALQAAHARERVKKNKYMKDLSQGTTFTPFVIKSYGGMSDTAISLIKRIIQEIKDHVPPNFNASSPKALMYQELSVALWRENAWKVLQYMQ